MLSHSNSARHPYSVNFMENQREFLNHLRTVSNHSQASSSDHYHTVPKIFAQLGPDLNSRDNCSVNPLWHNDSHIMAIAETNQLNLKAEYPKCYSETNYPIPNVCSSEPVDILGKFAQKGHRPRTQEYHVRVTTPLLETDDIDHQEIFDHGIRSTLNRCLDRTQLKRQILLPQLCPPSEFSVSKVPHPFMGPRYMTSELAIPLYDSSEIARPPYASSEKARQLGTSSEMMRHSYATGETARLSCTSSEIARHSYAPGETGRALCASREIAAPSYVSSEISKPSCSSANIAISSCYSSDVARSSSFVSNEIARSSYSDSELVRPSFVSCEIVKPLYTDSELVRPSCSVSSKAKFSEEQNSLFSTSSKRKLFPIEKSLVFPVRDCDPHRISPKLSHSDPQSSLMSITSAEEFTLDRPNSLKSEILSSRKYFEELVSSVKDVTSPSTRDVFNVASNNEKSYSPRSTEGRNSHHENYCGPKMKISLLSPASTLSDDSSNSLYDCRPDNSFLFAHRDNFGVTPERTTALTGIGEPPDLIRMTDDSEDDDDDDDDDYSEGNSVIDPEELSLLQRTQPDLSALTAAEILAKIDFPPLKFYEPKEEDLNAFLEPKEVGHINYLIKCYADAVFTMTVPSSVLEATVISPLDYLDIHISGVLQIFFILYKCEDFLNLIIADQMSLLENGMLPALLSLGMPMYNCEARSWSIPSFADYTDPQFLCLTDLLQIIPKTVVTNVFAFHEACNKLELDWTVSVLLLFVCIYTPTEKEVIEIERVDKLRDKYITILLKYTKWKWGIRNAALVFPELLKLMDAMLRLNQEIWNIQLRLSDEEVKALKLRLSSLNLSRGSSVDFNRHFDRPQVNPALFHDGVSFSSLQSEICFMLLMTMKHCEQSSESPKAIDEFNSPGCRTRALDSCITHCTEEAFSSRFYEPFRNIEHGGIPTTTSS